MKILLTSLVLIIAISSNGQGTYQISLSDVSVNPNSRFKVNRVIDGRRNKTDIGRVQPNGWKARPEIALLDRPMEQAMQDLLMRSYLVSVGSDGFIMRITRLAVSEIKTKKEAFKTALAEVAFDVFWMRDLDSCYHVGSTIGRAELTSFAVTKKHAENIAHALEDAIQRLAIRQPENPTYFAIADLGLVDFSFRDASTVPILNEDQHPDGVFLSYDEFLDNKPSITSGYEVETDGNVKLFRLDEAGKKEQVTEGIYALCKNNELYVLFSKNFYVLQRKNDSFHFIGPALVDPVARHRLWITVPVTPPTQPVTLFASVPVTPGLGVQIHYRIDLESGGFVEMSVVR